MDGTLVPCSPKAAHYPHEDDEKYPVPNLPYFEQNIFIPSRASTELDTTPSDIEEKKWNGSKRISSKKVEVTKTMDPQDQS